MFTRYVLILACAGGLVLGTGNGYAALASANIIIDWDSFDLTTSGDLQVDIFSIDGDDGSAFAAGGILASGSTPGLGGLNLSSVGPNSSASVLTTPELIDVSAATTGGFGAAVFERSFLLEALSGSGTLSLFVDVELQAEAQGAGSNANADLLFGYQVGEFGVLGSFASLEISGGAGDKSQTLATTLVFSVLMNQGDILDVFAEGEVDVNAVPVPAALWLFGAGLAALLGAARHKGV